MKRLFLAAICILILPLWFSSSSDDRPVTSAPFNTVAYAGHTVAGEWCRCGCFGCICDPDEQMSTCGGQSAQAVSDQTGATGQVASPADADPSLDFGSGALFVALALFALSRFRLNLF